MAWTKQQWQRQMRQAGWRNIGDGCYQHEETGAKFYANTVTQWRIDKYGSPGEAWLPFALNEELPTEAPF